MDQDVLESNVPLRILVGWAEGVSKNDAADIAKGFIQRRFDAVDASWYVTSPFMGGYFWEVHEGGKGVSYMPAIIEALTNDPGGQHWFPSGDRVFQVMMRDGKPFGILLQKSESKKIIESGNLPLRASGKMKQAIFKGTSVLFAGGGILGTGVAFFLASVVMFALSATPEPAVKDINLTKIPSAQWDKLSAVKPTEIVSKLEFENGDWKIEKRPFEIKNLKPVTAPKPPVQPPPAVNPETVVAPPPLPTPPPPSPGGEPPHPAPALVPPPAGDDPATPLVSPLPPVDPAVVTTPPPVPPPPVPPPPGIAPTSPPDAIAPPTPPEIPVPEAKETSPAPLPPVKPKAVKKTSGIGSPKTVTHSTAKNAAMASPVTVSDRKRAAKSPETASKQIGKPLSLLPGDVK